jgi:hypothetical protein
MVNMKSTLRFAALSAMVLGFASAGFVASASAEDSGKNGQDQKPPTDIHGEGNGSTLRSDGVKDVHGEGNGSTLRSDGVKDVHGEGNGSTLRSDGVKDVNAGNGGNAANVRAGGLGVGSGGNPTGEGALLTGNCFADMPVYNKEGKFIGRGIVNTCN